MLTRTAVKYMRKCAPNIRAVEMAIILGVTKARIGAILASEKLPTKVKRNIIKCLVCNKASKKNLCSLDCRERYYNITIQCPQCATEHRVKRRPYFKKVASGQKTFCNHSCRHKWYWAHEPERMKRGKKETK
jgi:hypothetical protein